MLCCSWVCSHLGNIPTFSCAHLRTLHIVVVVVWVEHGAYLVNAIIFIYKLTLGCYLLSHNTIAYIRSIHDLVPKRVWLK